MSSRAWRHALVASWRPFDQFKSKSFIYTHNDTRVKQTYTIACRSFSKRRVILTTMKQIRQIWPSNCISCSWYDMGYISSVYDKELVRWWNLTFKLSRNHTEWNIWLRYTTLVGNYPETIQIKRCTPTRARRVGAMPKVADSNPTRTRMVSGYLPTTAVYLSKIFHSEFVRCFETWYVIWGSVQVTGPWNHCDDEASPQFSFQLENIWSQSNAEQSLATENHY